MRKQLHSSSSSSPSSTNRHHAKSRRPSVKGTDWNDVLARSSSLSEEDNDSLWSDWQHHLAARKSPRSLCEIWPDHKKTPVLWGIPESVVSPASCKPIAHFHKMLRSDKKKRKAIDSLLARFDEIDASNPLTPEQALVAISLASGMVFLACHSSSKQDLETDWNQRLLRLCSLAKDADPETLTQSPWLAQVLGCELPLILAHQFPELTSCQSLYRVAVSRMKSLMESLLDHNGWLQHDFYHWWRPLLASWTRAWYLIKDLKLKEWDHDAQIQWEWFIRQSIRTTREDGSLLLTDSQWQQDDRDLLGAAVATSQDDDDRRLAEALLPRPQRPRRKAAVELFDDEDNFFSEWAGMAVLHNHWSPKAAKVAVAVQKQDFHLEVTRGPSLLKSFAAPEVSCNGKPLIANTEWEHLCTHHDSDVHYLEFQLTLPNQFRIQRQVLLARQDEFLYLADAVLSPEESRIDYRLSLSLPDAITPLIETENTEIYLSRKKIRSLLLPLSLPEWQSARADDQFLVRGQQLELTRTTLGRNLYNAVFIDLQPRRSIKPRTWRSLTVAESLEIVAPDVAAAYRVQVGKQQWIFYRSFTPAGNRTFLGQNHSSEFYAGRFLDNGSSEELMTIESA